MDMDTTPSIPPTLHDPDGTPMRAVWRLRKLRDEVRPAAWFAANERNWRIHPQAQRQGLRGALADVGWVDSVKVNLRTSPLWGDAQGIPTLFDGHCRIEEGLAEGADTAIPLEYYDLTPSEEALVLATLDPLGALAQTDGATLDRLLRDVSTDSPALQQLLSDLAAEPLLADADDAGDVTPTVPNLDPGEDRYKEQYGVIVLCESAEAQERVYYELKAQGYTCRVVVT